MGVGGIGIIKISGSLCRAIAENIFCRKGNAASQALRPHHLHFGWIVDPATRETIDEVLLAYMPGPASYTREDVVEIQCHSGYYVLERILGTVLSRKGVRLAEPGEFTRRAYINGRINLTQVEAIFDLVNARTGLALRQANDQLGGALSKAIFALKETAVELLTHIESGIDFPEEDMEVLSSADVLTRLRGLHVEMDQLLSTYEEGRIFREGIKATIIGRPNVGKSSLLNALLEEERAIVSHVPGTTRDTIEEDINVCGIPVTFVDTAGLHNRAVVDSIEEKGFQRTRAKASTADLVLFVVDKSTAFTDGDVVIFQEFREKKMVIVLNKSDLPSGLNEERLPREFQDHRRVSISAKYHQGIDELKETIQTAVLRHDGSSSMPAFLNRLRHKVSLEKARAGISQAIRSLENGASVEFAAFDLRCVLDNLGEVVGETTTDDILDNIFSSFCIGK